MKVTAVIEDFEIVNEQKKAFIQKVRQETECDCLIAVMEGDFLLDGVAARVDKYERAKIAMELGVDLVLQLPVFCTLNSADTYSFGSIALLERLCFINTLVIPCETDNTELLSKIATFLFMETREYQMAFKPLRLSGVPFLETQARTTEKFIPGAYEILKNPFDAQAAEIAKAMKRMYSMMKLKFMTVEKQPERDSFDQNINVKLGRMFRKKITSVSEDKAVQILNDTFGGTDKLTNSILQMPETIEGLEQMAEYLATPTRPTENIRCYLLNALVGIRKPDIAVCGLYSYAPFCRVIGVKPGAEEAKAQLFANSWIVMLEDYSANKDVIRSGELDDSKEIVANFDRKAHEILKEER